MEHREIKFRVWDGVDYMTTPFTLHDLQTGHPGFTSDTVVMQYTGLKDKNGVEVYEGDVLRGRHWRYEEEVSGIVTWMNGCWVMVNEEGDPIEFWDDGEHDWYNLSSFVPEEELEIIGNIYENPELLTP